MPLLPQKRKRGRRRQIVESSDESSSSSSQSVNAFETTDSTSPDEDDRATLRGEKGKGKGKGRALVLQRSSLDDNDNDDSEWEQHPTSAQHHNIRTSKRLYRTTLESYYRRFNRGVRMPDIEKLKASLVPASSLKPSIEMEDLPLKTPYYLLNNIRILEAPPVPPPIPDDDEDEEGETDDPARDLALIWDEVDMRKWLTCGNATQQINMPEVESDLESEAEQRHPKPQIELDVEDKTTPIVAAAQKQMEEAVFHFEQLQVGEDSNTSLIQSATNNLEPMVEDVEMKDERHPTTLPPIAPASPSPSPAAIEILDDDSDDDDFCITSTFVAPRKVPPPPDKNMR